MKENNQNFGQKNDEILVENRQNFNENDLKFAQKSEENLQKNDQKNADNDIKNMQKNVNFDVDLGQKSTNFDADFEQKNDQKSDENFNVSATKIVAKILKYLRENNFHLLSSVYSELQSAKIVENSLEISFNGENFKEILQNRANIDIINDIIKTDNLKISYNFALKEKEQDVVKILKDKFKEIEIKE